MPALIGFAESRLLSVGDDLGPAKLGRFLDRSFSGDESDSAVDLSILPFLDAIVEFHGWRIVHLSPSEPGSYSAIAHGMLESGLEFSGAEAAAYRSESARAIGSRVLDSTARLRRKIPPYGLWLSFAAESVAAGAAAPSIAARRLSSRLARPPQGISALSAKGSAPIVRAPRRSMSSRSLGPRSLPGPRSPPARIPESKPRIARSGTSPEAPQGHVSAPPRRLRSDRDSAKPILPAGPPGAGPLS